jgi:hypothetical protein
VFERFTERARQVVVLAQDEARLLRHNYIGTEHILLGLIREEEGIAARVLETFDLAVEDVRALVARIVGQGDEVTTGMIPFTPRAKRVLELSLREALEMGHNYIGTEHVLLGLLRERDGVANRILLDFVHPEEVRTEVVNVLSGAGAGAARERGPYVPKSPPVAAEVAAEIERVRKEKEQAIEAREVQRGAELRARERRLVRAAHELERAWSGEEPLYSPRAISEHERPIEHRFSTQWPFALGAVVFAVALGVGILVGWAIWG